MVPPALPMVGKVQHIAEFDGAAIGEEDRPCSECGEPILAGMMTSPGGDNGVPAWWWHHTDCRHPYMEHEVCTRCGNQHSLADDCS